MVLASKFMKMECLKKQPQFIASYTLFCVGILLLFASVSNAQLQFREPQRETINFQKSGLGSAVGEVACSSGNPKLQSAVLYQYADEKPQYIYGDDGSKACVAGSCLNRPAETGQSRTGCVAKKSDVKWFGPRDVRNDGAAFVTDPVEQKKYSSVGRIRCPTSKKRLNPETKKLETVYSRATAFHVAKFDVMVTNAHAFTEEHEDPVTKKITFTHLDAKLCEAVFTDYAGRDIETVPIKFVRSRWKDAVSLGDASQDIAIVKLDRESLRPQHRLSFDDKKVPSSVDGLSVTVVGFHGDNEIVNKNIIRKTQGQIYSAPTGFRSESLAIERGWRLSNRSRLIVGDYPSNHGTSGAPIFDGSGNLIGIHQGQVDRFRYVDGREESIREFNKNNNYNIGILFDDQFTRDLVSVINYDK